MKKDPTESLYSQFSPLIQSRIDQAIKLITEAKKNHQKVCVVTGSGPNIHEGVTTLIAELIKKGIIDRVITSSAVVSHEMAGTLDRVKRIEADLIKHPGMKERLDLPKGDIFELTQLSPLEMKDIVKETRIDLEFLHYLETLPGKFIIKAAGNIALPMGLRTELIAKKILQICKERFGSRYCFEEIAGLGADPHTMIGIAAQTKVPLLVSIPQLIGGGEVGLAIGDSIPIHDRCQRIAHVLEESSVIIESGLALAQEIHDGPYETYTGHGIWAQWQGSPVYSLRDKSLIRIDLDPNLEIVWQQQRQSGLVQQAITEGKPKTKLTGIPFRMEMSGYARLEKSLPIIGDIGAVWPIIGTQVAKNLGIQLDFISYPQETPLGQEMREWIVNNVNYLDRRILMNQVDSLEAN